MNKSVVVIAIAIGATLAAAVMLRNELQRERERADALTERVAALEPIERSTKSSSTRPVPGNQAAPLASNHVPAEPPQPPTTTTVEPEQASKPTIVPRGSLHARQQLERLQSALANGAQLQEYQIKLLIETIDGVRREIAVERSNRSAEASNVDWRTEEHQRIVRASYEFLFESQVEALMGLLERERKTQEAAHE